MESVLSTYVHTVDSLIRVSYILGSLKILHHLREYCVENACVDILV